MDSVILFFVSLFTTPNAEDVLAHDGIPGVACAGFSSIHAAIRHDTTWNGAVHHPTLPARTRRSLVCTKRTLGANRLTTIAL
jgi:hypothetical protein